MKRVLIMSDSHGNVENMVTAVEKENPDMIIHLGDCVTDAVRLNNRFLQITFANVPGNCDYSDGKTEKILNIDGYKVLICHGHTYNVKITYLPLECHAREIGVDIALFGHTHSVFYDTHNGVSLFNPGSIGAPAWGKAPSYGVITFDKENDVMKMDVMYLE